MPQTAWNELRAAKVITPQQSEAYLETLFEDKVLNYGSTGPEERRTLLKLASAVHQNHHDLWLKDFLESPISNSGNHFLESAIAHRNTDAHRAFKDAQAAEKSYLQVGNVAGAARSETELIYTQRRLSHASECLQEIRRLQGRIDGRSYTGFQILADFESANCETMLGNFDLGRRFAERTYAESGEADYPSLKLRATGLLSSLAWAEGKYQTAFNADYAGLRLYWDGVYEGTRAFQFYSDAALTAEQVGLWHLAASLQREAIASLAGTDAVDFRATAHYHRALSLERSGDPIQAQQEFKEAYALFGKMRDPSFLLANSEVELANIEIEQGNLPSAESHLEKASSAMTRVDNFLVQLSYYNTLADFERRKNQPDQEWKDLEKTISIARHGFINLNSIDNRWEWYREVDRSFHRLIQLEVEVKHDPEGALADWEAYRAAEIDPSHLTSQSWNRARLVSRFKQLRDSTLLSYVISPEKLTIFVADDRGVRVFQVSVGSETLREEAEVFLRLCSDPASPLQKVNQAGSRLYNRLLAPIHNELEPGRVLAIEADSFLSRVPWPALVMENGQYLDKKYMTLSTPGLFFATHQRQQKQSAGWLIAYPGAAEFDGKAYPPLPRAKEEADYVAKLEPGSTYLEPEQVTQKRLLDELPRASAFHFAGHGLSREHGGELLLSGKDQVLSASTVRRLDLSGMDLVVLSACSTAEANLDIARSPNGLVQAFLSAGARQVVASRWDVDSAVSSKFVEQFYGLLRRTGNSNSAIRRARHWTRQQKTMAHPYYWSAFEKFGMVN